MLTVALRAIKTKDGYKFKTQSNGRDFYKSPEDKKDYLKFIMIQFYKYHNKEKYYDFKRNTKL